MNTQTIITGVIALLIGATGTQLYHAQMMPMANMSSTHHQMPDGSMMKNMGTAMPSMSMESMMMDMTANLVGKTGKDLEKVFITDMIPHHQGAVDMARILVADPSVSEQMKQFGNAIITAQEAEIRDMKEWLKAY
jgi:uncharacterized protein (DUF305 family)